MNSCGTVKRNEKMQTKRGLINCTHSVHQKCIHIEKRVAIPLLIPPFVMGGSESFCAERDEIKRKRRRIIIPIVEP